VLLGFHANLGLEAIQSCEVLVAHARKTSPVVNNPLGDGDVLLVGEEGVTDVVV
jgi:hypothetical protein